MTSMHMAPTLPASVSMMAAMMLPSAIPAIARHARERDGVLAAPRFAGSYLGIWALVALAICILYRPPGALVAGALIVAAGCCELTPIKRECRRRCRETDPLGPAVQRPLLQLEHRADGGARGRGRMSVALMGVVAVVVLAQKLFPPRPAVDVPLAHVALGVAVATT